MSWFKRKSINRRFSRDHVLDVKVSSNQIRAARTRMAAIALALLFATVLGFFAVWRTGEWVLNRLIYQNKAFAIREIDVHTDGVIAVEHLRRWAGVPMGANLMALDLGRIKRDLELVPNIRAVAVERVMPHTLRLRVMEREALAQIQQFQARTNDGIEATSLHVDENGMVMGLLDPRLRSVPANSTNDVLPVIAGLEAGEAVPGRALKSARAKMALKLIAAFNRSPMAGLVDLQSVNVALPDVLQVTTLQGSEITFSPDDFDKQLTRWRAVFDEGRKYNKSIAWMDLSVPRNIPMKWAETAPPLPAAGTTSKNAQHNRRKNV
jgi:cell division septal protein FtsQ